MKTSPEAKRAFVEAYLARWLANPDWRFGQLFANLTGHHRDPFHVGDNELAYALGLSDEVPENWIPKPGEPG